MYALPVYFNIITLISVSFASFQMKYPSIKLLDLVAWMELDFRKSLLLLNLYFYKHP